MNVCATDGHLIDAIGPYLSNGKNNDSSITKDIFNKTENIENWFLPDDLFFFD